MQAVTVVDWILLGILVLSFVIGMWRGLVYEVLSVFVWLAAFILAQWFAPDVAEKLPMAGYAQPLRYATAFVLVFVGSAFVAGVIARSLRKMVAAVGLRPIDRTLGAIFGLFRGFILLLAVAVVMNMTYVGGLANWKNSLSATMLSPLLTKLKPLLPQEFGKYLT
jgi:membrane protein required for colicin V production